MENDQAQTEINESQLRINEESTMEAEGAPGEVLTNTEVSSSSCARLAMLTSNMEEMIEQLTDGFLSEVQPQLVELRGKTKEITKNQGILIETIQQENRKYSENKEIEEFTEMISVVQTYYAKLKKIKNEMDQLDERLGKLKKRSLKLKEKRQKKDQDEALKRERELALERELTAKPAT